jgi:sulfide:quinone oxidoreductase
MPVIDPKTKERFAELAASFPGSRAPPDLSHRRSLALRTKAALLSEVLVSDLRAMSQVTVQPAPAVSVPELQTAHHHILIVGGGSAGITLAAKLRRAIGGTKLALVEPSDRHYYQPLWTLAGGGVFDRSRSERPQAGLIPKGATWVRDAVAEFHPHDNYLLTLGGQKICYDFLVVAPGIQIDWDAICGLPESLGTDGVCSIWSYEQVGKVWDLIREFKGGTAVFTFPATPIKCPGAAQKIMYMADDHFRKARVRDRSQIIFASAAPSIYSVEKYAKTLRKVVERKGIQTRFRHNLVEIRPQAREAVFEHLDTGETVVLPYDLLHVAPPQSAPDIVKRSPLAAEGGWVDVDKHTLQHTRWPNVFSLGDASSLPTAKTAAAVRAQAPVLTKNLLAARKGRKLPARYDGYTACPIITGYGKLVLAEFDYDLQPCETFPFDQSKERYSMYLLKKHGLPLLYWQGMMRGRA